MASIDAATGFVRGVQGSLADVRQRNLQDQDRAAQQDSLAYAKNRQQTLDQRADVTFQQQQQDREASLSATKQLNDQERTRIATQAQQEGMSHVFDALDAGADPEQIMNLYGSTGQHSLKSLTPVDPKTGQFTMVGMDGGTFTGTTAQARAAIGIQKQQPKLTTVAKGGIAIDPSGKVVADNSEPDRPNYEQTDPTKDTWKTVNGVRTLVSKGVPKAGGADGESGPGGRKVSPFNPEAYSKEAGDVVGKYYQGVYDPKMGMFSFDPGTRDKATYGMSLAGQLARHFNGKLSAQEAGQYAAEVSAEIPTEDEAQTQAVRELGKNANPDQIKVRTTKIQRAARVLAAQKLDEYMQQMDDLIAAQESEASSTGNKGKRPSLDSFQK